MRLIIKHIRFDVHSWQVILIADGKAFEIGTECATLGEAQNVRTEFKKALLGLMITNYRDGEASLDPLATSDEITALIRYHDSAAKYHADCHETQTRIANTRPLYRFGEHQTKADWLRTSAEWKRGSKWHRKRSAFWKRQNNCIRDIGAGSGKGEG